MKLPKFVQIESRFPSWPLARMTVLHHLPAHLTFEVHPINKNQIQLDLIWSHRIWSQTPKEYQESMLDLLTDAVCWAQDKIPEDRLNKFLHRKADLQTIQALNEEVRNLDSERYHTKKPTTIEGLRHWLGIVPAFYLD